MIGLVFLACVAYSILWYMMMEPVFQTWFNVAEETLIKGNADNGINFFCFRSLVIAVLLGIQLPICLPKKLSALGYVSTAGVGIFISLFFIMTGLFFGDYLFQDASKWTFRDPWTPVRNHGHCGHVFWNVVTTSRDEAAQYTKNSAGAITSFSNSTIPSFD